MDTMCMTTRSVQISIDEDLLKQIDRRPETRKDGRSATIRRALRLYLELAKRREIDLAYARAYGSKEDTELLDLMGEQAWPEE